MADYPVKWFSSDMGGSPTGSDEAGALIDLLKACLITGFNTSPLTSLAFDSSTGLVTAEIGQGHGFLKHQLISISGADQDQFNGEFRITEAGGTWVAFAPDAAPISATATGELMEIKAAPIGGWEVVLEDSERNRIMLRSTNTRSNGLMLHVQNDHWDDGSYDNWSDASSSAYPQRGAKVKIVTDHTDIDTYLTLSEARWPIGWDYSSDGREWSLVGDDRLFYYTSRYAERNQRSTVTFGEFDSVIEGDAFATVLQGIPYGVEADWADNNDDNYAEFAKFGSSGEHYLARPYHQMPTDTETLWSKRGLGFAFGLMHQYPNPASYGFYVHNGPIILEEVIEGDGNMLRGYLPGFVQPLQTAFAYHKAVLDDLPSLEGVPVLLWLSAYDDAGGYYDYKEVNGSGLLGFRLDKWRAYQ
ncbi:hypothetical protein [Cobetia sp. 1CM21F]|uniref:hypothetical protein n=1 Tax=Cobetia sp. 1CM21F TaxID=2929163 RepID=UPI0020BDE9D6|nr:hypothetical protein [Cobetia sp. 1CM21F]MCK8068072.1 hypothetical protein [Cobetia sp. 1CM21F]